MFPRQCWSFGHKLQDWSKLGNSRKIVTNPEVQLLQFQSWITLETPTSSDSRTGKPLGFNPRQWSTNTVGFCFVYVKHGWNYWWVNILPNRARYHLFWSSNLQDISKTHPRRHLSLWEELLDERKQHGFPAKIRFSKRVTASRVLNFDSSAGSATWQIQMLVIPGDLWNPLNLFQNVTRWWNLWGGQVASSLLYSIVFFFWECHLSLSWHFNILDCNQSCWNEYAQAAKKSWKCWPKWLAPMSTESTILHEKKKNKTKQLFPCSNSGVWDHNSTILHQFQWSYCSKERSNKRKQMQ